MVDECGRISVKRRGWQRKLEKYIAELHTEEKNAYVDFTRAWEGDDLKAAKSILFKNRDNDRDLRFFNGKIDVSKRLKEDDKDFNLKFNAYIEWLFPDGEKDFKEFYVRETNASKEDAGEEGILGAFFQSGKESCHGDTCSGGQLSHVKIKYRRRIDVWSAGAGGKRHNTGSVC